MHTPLAAVICALSPTFGAKPVVSVDHDIGARFSQGIRGPTKRSDPLAAIALDACLTWAE